MRLGNFTILAGNAGSEADPELVSTGSSSSSDIALGRNANAQYTFSSNFGAEIGILPWTVSDGDVTNLQVWLDSADAVPLLQSTVTDDKYGIDFQVDTWTDKSPNAHVFGGDGTVNPSWTTIQDGPNAGTPAVKFGGVLGNSRFQSYLTSSAVPASGAGSRTIFTVVDRLESHRPTSGDSHAWRALWGWGSSVTDGKSSYTLGSDESSGAAASESYYIGYYYDEFFPDNGHRLTSNAPEMTICEYNGSVDKFYWTAEATPSTKTKELSTDTSTGLVLGSDQRAANGSNASTDFFLLEFVAFDSTLSTTDRQKIEGYLAWKWNFVTRLPTAHPYKLSAPLANPEFPYGNVHIYNVSQTSTNTELSVTQSLGTPLAGTVKSSFISITNGKFGG